MSAHLAYLDSWLSRAVDLQALSLAEAWTLQDVALLMEAGESLMVPEALHPAVERLMLLESEPANQLPA